MTAYETFDDSDADAPEGTPYRAVSMAAVASLILAVLSFLTAFGWIFVILPVLGLAVGWTALKRIRQNPQELTGRGLAWAGIALSALIGSLGSAVLAYAQMNAIPPGYHAISFSEMQPDVDRPGELIPAKVEELEGQNIYVRGFIYPGRQMVGLKEFVMVPSESHCSFCTRQLRSTEMIWVKMQGDLTTDYTDAMVGVGGRLELQRDEVLNPYGGFPYVLHADYVR
ncbi:MAG: DUF4190 domain-containing protein [Planctomycetota bacterium]